MIPELIDAQPNGIPLQAVLHMPPNLTANQVRPAVVLFFGGGWKGGTIEQLRPQCEHFAARGMIAVRGEYRPVRHLR